MDRATTAVASPPDEEGLLGALIARRDLVLQLARKEVIVRYSGSRAGFLWFALSPFLIASLLVAVFGRVGRFDVPGYTGYVLVGYVAWEAHASALRACTGSLRDHGAIVRKVSFPRPIIPVAVALSYAPNLAAGLLTAVAVTAFGPTRIGAGVLLLPLIAVLELTFVAALGVLTSLVNARFRDARFLVDFFLLAWFYATPVFYPVAALPASWRGWFILNPMATILEGYRAAIGLPSSFSPWGAASWLAAFLFILVAGGAAHRRLSPVIADYV